MGWLVDRPVGILPEALPFLCTASVAHPEERFGVVDVVVVPIEPVVLVVVVDVAAVVYAESVESRAECDGVVVYPEVLDLECAVRATPPIILPYEDAPVVVLEGVAVDFDI